MVRVNEESHLLPAILAHLSTCLYSSAAGAAFIYSIVKQCDRFGFKVLKAVQYCTHDYTKCSVITTADQLFYRRRHYDGHITLINATLFFTSGFDGEVV